MFYSCDCVCCLSLAEITGSYIKKQKKQKLEPGNVQNGVTKIVGNITIFSGGLNFKFSLN